MNLKVLFNYLRKAPFGGRLSSAQVAGVQAILLECQRQGVTDWRFIAYMLATAFHETGGRMTAIRENLNYTSAGSIRATWPRHFKNDAAALPYVRNPEGLANFIYGVRLAETLGNTKTGDGWKYRGAGLAQITGRRNFTRYGLADNPAGALELQKAAYILVHGSLNGVFTGRKLSDYLNGDTFDPYGARAVINGKDKAQLIATHYASFAGALNKASEMSGREVEVASMPDVVEGEELPDDVPAAESGVLKGIIGSGALGMIGTVLAALTNPYALAGFALVLAMAGAGGYMLYTGKLTVSRK